MSKSQNLKIHICNLSCNVRKSYKVICFLCDRDYYLRCFGLDQITQLTVSKPDSLIRFICSQCQKQKQVKRKSLSTPSTPTLPTPPAPPTSTSTPDKSSKDTNLSTIIMTLIDKVDKLSAQTQAPYNNSKTPNSDAQITTTNSTESVSQSMLDNMYSLLLKSQDKIIKLHTKEDEKESIKIMTSLFEKLLKTDSMPNKNNDAINLSKLNDWSMHFDNVNKTIGDTGRPSLIFKQSVDDDILDILRNSESRTWDALDSIRTKLDDQNNKIDDLIRLNPTNNLYKNEPIRSSLVDSVNIHDPFLFISTQENASIDDDIIARSTGNPDVTDKPKEAMTQINKENRKKRIPEPLKIDLQKRQVPNLSDIGPGIGLSASCTVTKNKAIEKLAMRAMDSLESHNKSPDPPLMEELNNMTRKILNKSCVDSQNITFSSDLANDSNISESDLISNKSWSIHSIHDISSDNIDGVNNAATNSNSDSGANLQAGQNATQVLSTESFKTSHTKPIIHELYLSRLPTNLSEADVRNYIKAKDIDKADDLRITKLVKRDADLSLLSFISFKIDADESTYTKLIEKNFWPEKCTIQSFIQKKNKPAKKITVAQSENFLCTAQSRTAFT